jgi:hypothetical protein
MIWEQVISTATHPKSMKAESLATVFQKGPSFNILLKNKLTTLLIMDKVTIGLTPAKAHLIDAVFIIILVF